MFQAPAGRSCGNRRRARRSACAGVCGKRRAEKTDTKKATKTAKAPKALTPQQQK